MFKVTTNNRGSTMIGALFAISILSLAGSALIQDASNEQVTTVNMSHQDQAFYVAGAGVEHAIEQWSQGTNPDGTYAFGSGQFSITTDLINGTISVMGQVGDARRYQTINGSSYISGEDSESGDPANETGCLEMDMSETYTSEHYIYDVKINKLCETDATLTEIEAYWNWDTCLEAALGNAEDTEDYTDPANANHVIVCHNNHDISIDWSGWENGHIYHDQDHLGSCVDAEATYCTAEDYDNGNAHVTGIGFTNTTIYNAESGVGSPSNSGAGVTSEEAIDVVDTLLDANAIYTLEGDVFPIRFDQAHPGYGYYRITARFSDGTEISGSFQDNRGALDPGFTISSGTLTTDSDATITADVLGSEITYGAGGPEVPVTVEIGTNSGNGSSYSYSSLFGGSDVDGGETYTVSNNDVQINYRLRARAKYGSFNARYDSSNTTQVRTLVDGDQAPALAGFGGQKPVLDFLAPYLDENGLVQLAFNQVIMLFELGVNMNSNPTSTAADFQDLVVLFTVVVPSQVNAGAADSNGSNGDINYDENLMVLKKKVD